MSKRSGHFLWLGVALAIAGCSASQQITHTARSTIEQRLLVQSLERSLQRLDSRSLEGKTVSVEFYGLTPDKDFAKEFAVARLQERRITVAGDKQQAQVHLKIFAPAMGVDQGQTFFGVPAVTVPIVGFTVPEIALFKSVSHRGYAALEMYSFDNPGGGFLGKIPRAVGEATYDQYTFLVVIHFKRSDLEDQESG